MIDIFLQLLSCGLMFSLLYQLISLFLTERRKAWYIRVLSVFIPCVVLRLINYFHNPIYNTLTTFALCLIISLLVFQGEWRTKIAMGILAPAIGISCEFFIIALDSMLMDRTLLQSSYYGIRGIGYSYLSIGLFCIVVVAIRLYVLTKKQKSSKQAIPLNPFITVIPILSTLLLYYILYADSHADDSLPIKIMSLIFFSGILILNVVFLVADNYSYGRYLHHTELMGMAHQVRLYELLIKQQEENLEKLTAATHDYNKILSTLRQYLTDTYGDDERVYKIIGQEMNCVSATALKYTYDSKTLTAIIRDYAAKCDKAEISFEPGIRYDDLDFFSFQDLCTLLCNLLENAFVSALSSKNAGIDKPYVNISIFRKNKMLFIQVRNSFEYKGKKGQLGLKTKKQLDHKQYGIGVKNVYRVVDKHEGSVSFHYTEFEFQVHVIIPIQ